MSAPKGKKIRKKNSLFAPVSFLLICAALVFGLSVFFRVNDITVIGNGQYTAEEIIEASGIQQGDNLFFINRGAAVARINNRLPYVESAYISRSLPNRLTITVAESDAIAAIPSESSGLWVIDRGCKLLSQANGAADGLIYIEGLTAIAPEVGQVVAAGESESPKVAYLAVILRELSELGLKGDVSSIDMSNISNPSFRYLDRFTVKLGTDENLDYKFSVLLSTVEKLAEGDRGTLDLSIDRRAHLTYD